MTRGIDWARVDWTALLRDMEARWVEQDNEAALANLRAKVVAKHVAARVYDRWLAFWVLLAISVLVATAGRAQMAGSSTETLPTMNGVVYIATLTPAPEYPRWYAAMERCLGMKGKYRRVRWYVAPRPWSDGLHGTRLTYGLYWGPHRIILNAPEARDSVLVSHEMAHDILASNRVEDSVAHPKVAFGPGRCSEEFHRP